MTRPIVFMSDYGLADEFVGVCHGVIARIAPDARVIDLTHQVSRHDVLEGAITLARAARFMPDDAIFVAVVDPGVGATRRPIAVEVTSGAILVGPDNGILSMAWEALGGLRRATAISPERAVPAPTSRTFHGRDVFSPAAAHLATGLRLEELGSAIPADSLTFLALPAPIVSPGRIDARVVAVDGFGNVQLNVTPADLGTAGLGDTLRMEGREIPLVNTFSDVSEGALAALVDSQGYIALIVNQGNAAELLGLGSGDPAGLQ